MATRASSPPYEERTLPNGLRLVLVPASVHRAVASLYLRVGSRFESRADNGISHFLEHMLFRGVPAAPSSHELALAFERLGGMLYAATHVDHGLMTVSVPPHNLARALELLGQVATSPLLLDAEVERGIVREEILEDRDDDGREIDPDNLSRRLLYGEHPLGYTITGDPEALDTFDEARLRAHHARHYGPTSSVLVLAGNLADVEALASLAARAFAALPDAPAAALTPAPGLFDKARVSFVDNPSSQTDLRVAFRGPSERAPDEPAVEMLLRVLDDGMSTRLYSRLCDGLGLCYDVSAMFEAYEDDGVVDFAAGCGHERAPEVLRQIFSLVSELAAHGPTDAELDKARDRHLWSTEAMLDDADELAGFYGLASLAGIARTPEARHAELASVGREDVRRAAERLFRPERLGVVAVGLVEARARREIEKAVRSFGALG